MLLSTSLQDQIARCLDRLRSQSSRLPTHQLVSPFYYCSHLLSRYSKETKSTELNRTYFKQFKDELNVFQKKDFSQMKTHYQELVDEIFQISSKTLSVHYEGLAIRSKYQPAVFQQAEQDIECDDLTPISFPQSIKKTSFSEISNRIRSLNTIAEVRSTGSSENLLSQSEEKSLYQRLSQAYKQHRIDEAYELMEQYTKNYDLDEVKKNYFSTIELQYKTMMSFYKEFDHKGWIFDKEENGISLEYKIYQEQKQVGVRVSAEIDVPIDHFLAIITEIDLFEKYAPFCYGSRQLKVVSRNEKIGTSKVFIPCLTDREVYFYAAGYDRIKKNGSVFFFSKTINNDQVYQQKYGFKVPQESQYVRLEYKYYIIQYAPISLNKAKVRLAVKADMKMNFLPLFIINMSARKFAFEYFQNIPKLSKRFKGSQWQKKVKENQEFYDFFSKKIKEQMFEK